MSGTWYSPYSIEIHENDTSYNVNGRIFTVKNQKAEFFYNDDTFKIKYDGYRINWLHADTLVASGAFIQPNELRLNFSDRYDVYFPLGESKIPFDYALADSLKNRLWKIPISDGQYFLIEPNEELWQFPSQYKRNVLRTEFTIGNIENYMNHYFLAIYSPQGYDNNVLFHIYDTVKGGFKVDYYDFGTFYNTGYHQVIMTEIPAINGHDLAHIEEQLLGTWSISPYPSWFFEWEDNKNIRDSYWQMTLTKGKYNYKRGGIFDDDTINLESSGKWRLGRNGRYLELYDDDMEQEIPHLEDGYHFFEFLSIESLTADSMKVNMDIELLQKGYVGGSFQSGVPFVVYKVSQPLK